jgi:hypothetical protein
MSEAYLQVRGNDEGEAQRHRWTVYETIIIGFWIRRGEKIPDIRRRDSMERHLKDLLSKKFTSFYND